MLQQHKYFIHGDRNPANGLYFCRRCDAFVNEAHFQDESHIRERNVRVKDGIVYLRKRSANNPEAILRAEGTANLFESELPAEIRSKLQFSEPFLAWAMKTTTSEAIREAIQDSLLQESQIPRYDDILDALAEESRAEFEGLYNRFLLK